MHPRRRVQVQSFRSHPQPNGTLSVSLFIMEWIKPLKLYIKPKGICSTSDDCFIILQIWLLLFVLLYVSSYATICAYRKKAEREEWSGKYHKNNYSFTSTIPLNFISFHSYLCRCLWIIHKFLAVSDYKLFNFDGTLFGQTLTSTMK